MTGVIEGFRWALLGQLAAQTLMVVISSAVMVVLLVDRPVLLQAHGAYLRGCGVEP